MDVIIFGGQSNMMGQTGSVPQPNHPIKNAFEYKYMANEIVPLIHPVGETIGDWLHGAEKGGGGSLVPAFCDAYAKLTNKQVLAVHAAHANTTVGEWLYGTQNYAVAQKKITAALKTANSNFKIEKIYFVWLQGETDALIATSKNEYKERLTLFKNQLKAHFGVNQFGIIRVGYFASFVRWLNDERDKTARTECDEQIMLAQDELAKDDEDFVILTRILSTLSTQERYLNPEAVGHYNNEALELIGETAGTELAKIRNAQTH